MLHCKLIATFAIFLTKFISLCLFALYTQNLPPHLRLIPLHFIKTLLKYTGSSSPSRAYTPTSTPNITCCVFFYSKYSFEEYVHRLRVEIGHCSKTDGKKAEIFSKFWEKFFFKIFFFLLSI